MSTHAVRYIATGVIAAAVFVAVYTRAATPPPTPQIRYPAENTSALLTARKQQQLRTVEQFKVFYQFQFQDKLEQSGVTFVNHVVELKLIKHFELLHGSQLLLLSRG